MKKFTIKDREAVINFIDRGEGLYSPVISHEGKHKDIPLLLDQTDMFHMKHLMGILNNNYDNIEIFNLTTAGAARIAMRTDDT